MSPALKYSLGRVGIFVACAVPALFLLPSELNGFLKLIIALVASAILSFFLLRRWRDEVADSMSATARRRGAARRRLRAALAGDEEPADAQPREDGSD